MFEIINGTKIGLTLPGPFSTIFVYSRSIAGFGALTALSPSDDPEKCSLPFDKNRSGFVLGEGAGIVAMTVQAVVKHLLPGCVKSDSDIED